MSSYRREIVSGVFFSAITKYSSVLINFLVTVILARLISPSDFGVVAIAMVFSSFFSMLSDAGIGPAIIQSRTLDASDIESLFTFTIFLGISLSFFFFVASDMISIFYSYNDLSIIIKFLSSSILFRCASIVPMNLLMKNKCFKTIAKSTLYSHVICGIVAISCALLGFGIYSLLVVPILGSFLLFIAYYRSYSIKPAFRISFKPLNKIFYYSLYQFLFTVINYFSRNVDKLILGKVFGATSLGYYEKSQRLMMMPVGYLSNVISPVIQPIFSDYQDNKDWLANKSLKILEILALVGFPLSVLLYLSSTEIIIIIFGDQWYGAIYAFKILSISIGFQMIYSPQGAFFQSANATKLLFYNGLLTAALNIVSVIIGCLWLKSLTALCYGIVASYITAFFVTYYLMCKYVFKIYFSKFLNIFKHSVLISAVVFLFIWIVDIYIDHQILLVRLIIKLLVFISILAVFEYYRPTICELKNIRKK